ncbi:M28 family metallopeptidase [Psychrosphaera aestuarii]|uniref:M28 family metallopeptidase n=1 Tax=Psychrosphaera aestuarii TaxID=1266052 RepID=UPI001B31F78C|nr:M28 family metallopeptidase [Psychrosphaera aestuarii]
MKTIISSVGLMLVLAVTTACSDKKVEQTNVEVEKSRIQAHLEFLADDLLEGRDTGSKGYDRAALYVATEFKKMGLQPAGIDGSYMQPVTFRKGFLDQQSPKASIITDAGTIELKYPQDYITGPNMAATDSTLEAEVVFVGYGIVAEDFGYNDYEGLDVEGKIVVTLRGRPEAWPSEEGAHLSREKTRFAAERGAVGVVSLHTPKREKVRPYTSSLNYLRAPSMRWLDNEGNPFGGFENIKMGAYLNISAAEKLFANAPTPLEEIFNADSENLPVKGFPLDAKLSLASKSKHEEISSPNVVAILPGTDPKLKDEYVVFTAHLDHIGYAQDVSKKDRINNGAMDNASGVSILLETARVLTESAPMRRSVLFTVVTGEEKGLLGSSYYANNPTVPVNDMVANINLDMPVLLYDFADIIAFGANHSSMGSIVEKAAGKFDIALSPDPMPEQAIFTRSDHYNFVKQGVPAVFLMTGFTSKTEGEDGGKVWGDFFANHYHQPSDSLDLPINYNSAKLFTEINIGIAREVAAADQRPTWNDDSFFGKTYGQKDK